MSDAVIVAISVAAVANMGMLLKLVFAAGGMKRSLDSLVSADAANRLTKLETRVDGLDNRVDRHSDQFTPAPVMMPLHESQPYTPVQTPRRHRK